MFSQSALDNGGVKNSLLVVASNLNATKFTSDVSDDGDDTDGNTTNDITFFLLGVDTDNDGYPNKIDIDDDNDGILDKDEACLSYLLDGNSFENYYKAGSPINPTENKVSAFPNSTVIFPWSSVNGDGDVWDAAFFNGTQWDPQQGTYFLELRQVGGTNTGAYWDESSVGTNTFDRIMYEQDVYPSSTYSITYYVKGGGRGSSKCKGVCTNTSTNINYSNANNVKQYNT